MKAILVMEKKLIDMTERIHEATKDFYGKSGEPSISVEITNNLKWFAEIYSYVFNFKDGGRHHHFEADTYEQLVKDMWLAIEQVEKEELIPLEVK